MPDNPLITIITIVYNDLKGLKKTMKSIKEQAFTNFEYIVIDGRSNDGSSDYIKEKEADIDYWVSEKDEGIADAFNKGITRAKGDWILFLNAGDYFYSNQILQDVEASLILNSGADVVFGKIALVNEEGDLISTHGRPYFRKTFEREMTIPHQAAFHNRSLFEKYGLFELSYKYCMDYELLLRVKNPDFVFVDMLIAKMLMGGVSQQSPKEVYKEFNKVKKLHLNTSDTKLKFDFYENMLRYRLSKLKQRLLS